MANFLKKTNKNIKMSPSQKKAYSITHFKAGLRRTACGKKKH